MNKAAKKRILIALPYQKLQRIPKLNAIATTRIVSKLILSRFKYQWILPLCPWVTKVHIKFEVSDLTFKEDIFSNQLKTINN